MATSLCLVEATPSNMLCSAWVAPMAQKNAFKLFYKQVAPTGA